MLKVSCSILWLISKIDYDYLIQGHKIMIRTVDLNQEWRLIHKRLIDIIIDREN